MSGMTGAIFNLTNTIIGAGVLTLPYAFAKVGRACVRARVYVCVCRLFILCSCFFDFA